MTLNGVIALILVYLTEFDSFAGLLRQWLKIDLYCLQNIVFHFWPQLPTLQRGLSAIAELVVLSLKGRGFPALIIDFSSCRTASDNCIPKLELNKIHVLLSKLILKNTLCTFRCTPYDLKFQPTIQKHR